MSIYTALWVGWILYFAVVEGYALITDFPQGTLSVHIRRWFSVKSHLGRTAFIVVTTVFYIWFVPHIV